MTPAITPETRPTGKPRKVAIIHYWLVTMRGGERVLERICELYPEADIYTHVVDENALSATLKRHRIFTTSIAKLPLAKKQYQKYLPLMPAALEALDLSAYDLVISCEAGPAKGVITRPDAVHVTYCHSPMRYLWDQYHAYRAASGKLAGLYLKLVAPRMRAWDRSSASRPDLIMANSQFVRRRIAKFWGREASVVYPPVDVDIFHRTDDVSDECVWISQLVPYKRPDIAVDAFTRTGRKLHVIGDGPMLETLKARAGPNVRFTTRMKFDELRAAYAKARALIFTAEEDFGIIPVESQAAGRPVVVFGRGGGTETVIDGKTGIHFHEQTAESLIEALDRFDAWLPSFDPEDAIANAQRFARSHFLRDFAAEVARAEAMVAADTALANAPGA
ncbi:glycosyltransferase [Sphingomonas sp. Leaf21]|uniref:glycosyltransferase n=1 Tax=Sphingomonas sp. Leaf21 TaxID=2876550 RepID=UPI001E3C30F7|nr:glycosyltransferase [Sphingomonas sp. Leaf21]